MPRTSREVGDHLHVLNAVQVMRDAHRPADDDVLCGEEGRGGFLDAGPAHSGAGFDVGPACRFDLLAESLEIFGVLVDELAIDAASFEHDFDDAGQPGDVAADVRLDVLAGDLRTEQQAPRIARHAEVDEAEFLRRIDDDDFAAASPNLHQAAHQPRMVRRRVAADQNVEVAGVEVFQPNRPSAGSDRAGQADSAGLMAVVRAVVDVVRAEQPRQQLQQEAGFIRGSAAGVKKL